MIEINNSLVNDMVEAIKENRLVFFIGAGVSISQGYPNWDCYVEHLIKFWQNQLFFLDGKNKINRQQYLVFDAISKAKIANKRKVDLVNSILFDIFGDESFNEKRLKFEKQYFKEMDPFKPYNKVLEKIVNLDSTFITVNYDYEIEKHIERFTSSSKTINDLKHFRENQYELDLMNVLHIHGTPESNSDFFISSSSDYSRIYLKNPVEFNNLRKWFERKSPVVIFIGVSMEEDEVISLLSDKSKNYALLKKENIINEDTDKEYRKIFSEYFLRENYTDVIWYGNKFEDLPIYIEELVNTVKHNLGMDDSFEDWETLLSYDVDEDKYLDILNKNINSQKSKTFLNELYLKSLTDIDLAEKLTVATINSDIFKSNKFSEASYSWKLISNHLNNIGDWTIIENYFKKGTVNVYSEEIYRIFDFAINNNKFNSNNINEIFSNIGSNSEIYLTAFNQNSKILGFWFKYLFTNSINPLFHFVNPNGVLKIELTQEEIEEINECINEENKYLCSNYEHLIRSEKYRTLHYLIINNCFVFEKSNDFSNTLKNIIKNIVIQKILVHSFLLDEIYDDSLLNMLVESIDFKNEFFGEELNEFINKYKTHKKLEGIKKIYKNAISTDRLIYVKQQSFITQKDLNTKSVEEILDSLKKIHDFQQIGEFDEFKEGTISETINFLIGKLEKRDDDFLAIKNLIFSSDKDFIDKFFGLYVKALISDKIILEPNEVENIEKIVSENINITKFPNIYWDFFKYEIENGNEIILEKLFEIDVQQLEASNSEILHINSYYTSELGRYIDILLKLSISKSKYTEKIIQIIKNNLSITYSDFAKGVFFEQYNSVEENLNLNSLLGYIYYHKVITPDIYPRFKETVLSLLKSSIIVSELHLNVIYKIFMIALNIINPEKETEINFENNFIPMIDIILTNKLNFNFEKEWFEILLKNADILEIVFDKFGTNYSNSNKVDIYKNIIETNINDIKEKIALHLIVYRFEEDNKKTSEKQDLIDLFLLLLKNDKIDSGYLTYTSILTISKTLDAMQKNEMIYNLKKTKLLTPLEYKRLIKEI